MIKCLLSNNCLLKFLALIIKSLFIVLSNIFGQTIDSVLNKKTILVVKLFPVSIMSIVICLIAGQILYKFLHYVIIFFLCIIFLFTTLFIILYHVLKEPENRLIIITAR